MTSRMAQCLTQFDLIMLLARQKDGAAKVFDQYALRPAENNFMFQHLTVGPADSAENDRSSRNESLRAPEKNGAHPLRASMTEFKDGEGAH